MKAFPLFIPEKKRQIGFQTKISVTHRFRCFTSSQPHPFCGGKVRIQQRQLSQLQLGGFFSGGYGPAAVGDYRSERHGQLSARLAGVPQRFQLLPSDLLLVFKDCMESFHGGALHIDSRDLRILCQEHPLF